MKPTTSFYRIFISLLLITSIYVFGTRIVDCAAPYLYIDGAPNSVYSDDYDVSPQEITLSIKVGGIDKLGGIEFELVYDGYVLELMDCDENTAGINLCVPDDLFEQVLINKGSEFQSVMDGMALPPGTNVDDIRVPGKILFTAANYVASPVPESGIVAEAKFKVKRAGAGTIVFVRSGSGKYTLHDHA